MLPPKPIKQTPQFKTISGVTRKGFKLGIYGPEGIGKSGLEVSCPGIVIADIESSTEDYDCVRASGIDNWPMLRLWIQSLQSGIAGIDSITRAEDWAAQHVIKNKIGNDGTKASDSLEDFKYNAGLQFVTDEFRKLLGDIEAARKRGVSFVMVAHSRVNRFKNPDGNDFVRYEPRLIDSPKGSNMLQWVQFLDHLAFIDLDKSVERSKVTGKGSRTIYLNTAANRISKCRGIDDSAIDYPQGDTTIWKRLGVIK